jgi:uncharacterized protein
VVAPPNNARYLTHTGAFVNGVAPIKVLQIRFVYGMDHHLFHGPVVQFFPPLARPTKKEPAMAINQELLEILACPQCKGKIQLNSSQDGLVCETCRLVYEIRDDIPIMLIEEAKPL